MKNPSPEAVYPKGLPDDANAAAKDGSPVATVGKPFEVAGENRRDAQVESKT